ncbi:MAG: FMN-binding protein [Oscillospiraceae bacterium]|jgi:electron transport complex protein RnfG|nr:FMN-binding protein [Oscillospiraceae bacterium]
MIKPVAVLLAICIVIAGVLAALNEVTAPVIADATVKRTETAMREIMPEAYGFREAEDAPYGSYAAVRGAYEALGADGETLGYILNLGAKGFNGRDSITLIALAGLDGRILGTRTLVNGDTKGKGDLAAAHIEAQINASGVDLAGAEAVDAYTGATISSNAYRAAVIDAVAFVNEYWLGGAK